MTKDPIWRMNVDEKSANFKSELMGKTYYFCSQMCKATFDKNLMKYTSSGGTLNIPCTQDTAARKQRDDTLNA